jgi:hypothetical protein
MRARTMGKAIDQHEALCGSRGIISINNEIHIVRHSGNSESKDVLILQSRFLEAGQIRRPDVLPIHNTIPWE